MVAGPEDVNALGAAGFGHMLASHADRERAVDLLKAAFAQGCLTRDEFEGRVGWTFASRTYAELAAVTADIPARQEAARQEAARQEAARQAAARQAATRQAAGQPVRRPPRRPMSNAAKWLASGLITPAILTLAFSFISEPSARGYGVVAFVVAFGYFMFWLSAGADMLWQWHAMCVPSSRMCVRCAHTAASHREPTSCSVRPGPLKLNGRCSCEGYLPPGRSPKTTALRLSPTR
jgi:hypothetical protein